MVSEPGLSYSSPNAVKPPVSEFSDQIMDMLLQQPTQVKLLIINKLAGSMLVDKETGTTHENPEVCSRKEIEAKLDNLHVKGHLREQKRKGPKNRPKHTRKRIHQAKKNFLEKFKTASYI